MYVYAHIGREREREIFEFHRYETHTCCTKGHRLLRVAYREACPPASARSARIDALRAASSWVFITGGVQWEGGCSGLG